MPREAPISYAIRLGINLRKIPPNGALRAIKSLMPSRFAPASELFGIKSRMGSPRSGRDSLGWTPSLLLATFRTVKVKWSFKRALEGLEERHSDRYSTFGPDIEWGLPPGRRERHSRLRDGKKHDAPCLGCTKLKRSLNKSEIKVAIIPVAVVAFVCARWSTTSRWGIK